MVGPVRTERPRKFTIYQPKERKVRFTDEEDPLFSLTPDRVVAPDLVAAAETHRSRKRKSVDEWRRRISAPISNEEGEPLFAPKKRSYPKTPVKKSGRVKRIPLPTDKMFDFPSDGSLYSSPTGRAIGMPDITDFSEPFEVRRGGFFFAEYDPFPSPTPKTLSLPTTTESARGSKTHRGGEDKWHEKYNLLRKKHLKLQHFVEDLKGKLASQGIDIKFEDGMICDTDNEDEPFADVDETMESFFAGPSTPDLTMTSYSSPSTFCPLSPAVAEPGTPAVPGTLPARHIEDDYDGRSNGRHARKERDPVDARMDEAVDRLADATSSKLRIAENYPAKYNFSLPNFHVPPTLRFEDFSA